MEVPLGIESSLTKKTVCKLQKSFYILKQSSVYGLTGLLILQ